MAELKNLFENFDSLVFFDTETTGLKATKDRIIELAAVELRLVNGRAVVGEEMDSFVKLPAYRRLPEFITKLTGISDAILSEQGEDEEAVAERFTQMLKGKNVLLIAHNARFDLTFVQALLARQGRGRILQGVHCLDTLKVYKKRRAKNHKLCDAIADYGLEDKVCNSHRAIDDVRALIEVAKAMNNQKDDLDTFVQGVEEYLPELVQEPAMDLFQYAGLF